MRKKPQKPRVRVRNRVSAKDVEKALKGKLGEELNRMTAKAKELGWSPNMSKAENDAAARRPKFVYVKYARGWGPWKRGKDGNQGGFVLSWGAEKIGFGETTFILKNKKIICETECMSESFIRAAVDHFLRTGVVYEHR